MIDVLWLYYYDEAQSKMLQKPFNYPNRKQKKETQLPISPEERR